ncbi:cobalamin biosynthesis protein [Fortiea contorta]|uniref:cobalamin biosynthesis protein n=1 Tax=Fortiea contorta TaxID=1892405 RepID=UPI0003454309|nr:cobalamin biosynthesis protein [Fortiea contorta]
MHQKTSNSQNNQQVLWVGIGCQRGTSWELIATAIEQVCRDYQLNESAIAGIATIDTKASEAGLVELCRLYHWCLKTFPAEVLSTISIPNPSPIIAKVTGTPSVAEAAALCAGLDLSQTSTQKSAPFTRQVRREIEVNLLVPKTIFRLDSQPGTVTVAVAKIVGSITQQL